MAQVRNNPHSKIVDTAMSSPIATTNAARSVSRSLSRRARAISASPRPHGFSPPRVDHGAVANWLRTSANEDWAPDGADTGAFFPTAAVLPPRITRGQPNINLRMGSCGKRPHGHHDQEPKPDENNQTGEQMLASRPLHAGHCPARQNGPKTLASANSWRRNRSGQAAPDQSIPP